MLDRFLLEVQTARDLLVGKSAGDQFYHLGFAGRQ
jgi:hypothetical protein